MTRAFLALAAIYVALVIFANWLASAYLAPVGFGYIAPAGVFAISAVLVLRDWLQELAGLRTTMALVYLAGVVSWIIGSFTWSGVQRIAIASVVAFTISETIDAVVFTRIRRRSVAAAVFASSTVGNAVDSVVFLALAFGSQEFFAGQFIGKGWMVVAGTLLTLLRRRLVPAPTRPRRVG